jgi:hypothetical protein
MHPIVAHELARGRIADFHHEAERSRRLRSTASHDVAPAHAHIVSTVHVPDPTRLVRRLLTRLRPAVAP